MKAFLLAAATLLSLSAAAHAAETVPCEDMLNDLRDAAKTVQLSEADQAKVADLQDKGIERCQADDDEHADEFFAQALKLLGK
jgi:opacity protein-like surface antigen